MASHVLFVAYSYLVWTMTATKYRNLLYVYVPSLLFFIHNGCKIDELLAESIFIEM